MEVGKPPKHFVLVHGACHGAWCWYKLKPLLEASGHKVTALDLSASGIDTKKIEEVYSLHDYTKPLLKVIESLPPNEKVILVGHSYGGLSLGLVMDKYPQKVSVGVFLTAFLPDSDHSPGYVVEEHNKRTPPEEWLDSQFQVYHTPANEPCTSVSLGPNILLSKLYQLCSAQDLALAKMLIRPGSFFDLSKEENFSKEGFGSVKRVAIVCCQDKGLTEDFQRWQIDNAGNTQVIEIKDADHMAMLSKPKELCQCLLEMATNIID